MAQDASAQALVVNAAVNVEPTMLGAYAAMLGMQTTQLGRQTTDNDQGGAMSAMHSDGGARIEAEGAFSSHVGPQHAQSPVSESDLDNAPGQICNSCDDEMLLCDLCNKAYHAACQHLFEIPEGAWVCQECSDLIFDFTSDKTVDQYHAWLLRHNLDILTYQLGLSPQGRRVRGRFVFPPLFQFRDLCVNASAGNQQTEARGSVAILRQRYPHTLRL
jgi:hypothetical protein